jgi:hypothetical protein
MRFIMGFRKASALLVLGTAGLGLTPHAQACGQPRSAPALAALALLAPQMEARFNEANAETLLTTPFTTWQQDNDAERKHSIVGMWTVGFYDARNKLWDVAIEQFNTDGNEMTNDNAYSPALGNLCWGVWTKEEKGKYKMKHVGWVFNSDGSYFGRFDFKATLTLNSHGEGFTGTYVGDQEDLSGNILPGMHDEGTLKAARFGAD